MENDSVVGIDEAGRGPVLGPLVLCGVWADPSQLRQIEALAVEDSKAYGSSARARARRKQLAEEICAIAEVEVEVAEPDEIDHYTAQGGLNRLEHEMAVRVIEALPHGGEIVADGQRLFAPLQARYPHLLAVDRADRDHRIVAAASIVAKSERDRQVEALLGPHETQFGKIRGGGYPNAATASFLRSYVAHYGELPEGIRYSWSWDVLKELRTALPAAEPIEAAVGEAAPVATGEPRTQRSAS